MRISIVLLANLVVYSTAQCTSNTPFPDFPVPSGGAGFPAIGTLITRARATEKITLRYPDPLPANWKQQTNCPHNQAGSIWPQGVQQTPNSNIWTVTDNVVKVCGGNLGLSSQPIYIKIPAGKKLIIGDSDIDIQTTGIHVEGELLIGSPTCRLRSKISLTLHHQFESTPSGKDQFINKGIFVDNGKLDIHGARYSSTWTRLAKAVKAGDKEIYLQDKVNWEVGQSIVLTTSHLKDSLDFNRNDIAVIQKVELAVTGITRITLVNPVQHEHFAGTDYQVEVGLLSRRIIIQGDALSYEGNDNCPANNDGKYSSIPCRSQLKGDGGHIRIQGPEARGRVAGVELYRMGKTNVLGQYPMHFHLMGSSPDSFFTDSSIHRSFFRGISVHGTHDTLIQENVAHDIIGHCYYLEDGIEQRNKFMYNLASHVHFLGTPQNSNNQFMEFVYSGPDLLLPADVTAAGFYITNAGNTYIGNAASGGYAGYAIVKLPKSLKEHYGMVEPEKAPFYPYEGGFDGNSCHSSGWWWGAAGCIYAGGILEHYSDGGAVNGNSPLRYNPGRISPARDTRCDGKECYLIFTNTKIFLTSWGINNWGKRSEMRGLEAHNFGRGLGLLGQHYLTDMLIGCRSTQHQPDMPAGLTGYEKRYWEADYDFFAWYDTAQQHIITNTEIRNCGNAARNAPVWRYLTHSDRFVPEYMQITKNIKYKDSDTGQFLILPTQPGRNTISARYASWYDADGSVMGYDKPKLLGSTAAGAGKWWLLDPDCKPHPGSELMACAGISRNGNPRTVGSMEMFHNGEQRELVSKEQKCSNGNTNIPCETIGYVAHFGTPSDKLKEDGIQISHNAKFTGPSGGFGWYIAYDAGPPRRFDIDRAGFQGSAIEGQMVAMSYPKGTTFEIRYLTRYCNSNEDKDDATCGRLPFTLVESREAVRDGPGNTYYFDNNDELLYFKVVQTPIYKNVFGPDRLKDEMPHFEREGLSIPIVDHRNFIRVLANCNGKGFLNVGKGVRPGEGGQWGYCDKPQAMNIPLMNHCDQYDTTQYGYDDCDVTLLTEEPTLGQNAVGLPGGPAKAIEIALGTLGGAFVMVGVAAAFIVYRRRKAAGTSLVPRSGPNKGSKGSKDTDSSRFRYIENL